VSSANSRVIDAVVEVNVTGTNRGEQIGSKRVTNQARNSINSISWGQTTIPLRNGPRAFV